MAKLKLFSRFARRPVWAPAVGLVVLGVVAYLVYAQSISYFDNISASGWIRAGSLSSGYESGDIVAENDLVAYDDVFSYDDLFVGCALRVGGTDYFGCGSISTKELVIEGSGSNGTDSPASILWVRSGRSGPFLSFDDNEVQAYSSSGESNATLYLQDFGGDVDIGSGSGNGADVYMQADLYVSSEVVIDGDLEVSGRKNFVMPHPDDPTKEIVYSSLEGPEVGTYLRGTAKLVNGVAIIRLPEHFSFVTAEQGLTVVLTPLGEWLQLYVVEKSPQQIIVREAQGKSGRFDYLVQGVRIGFEKEPVVRERRTDED